MATINGYTAERMKEIEDSAIVDGDVVGDNLILKRFDGGEIDAGSVRGDPGTPGVDDVADQLAALLLLVDPPGIPKPYTGAAAPSGYGICDAATEYTGATYPSLATLYGTGSGCINGSSADGKFRLPNLKGRVLVGRDAAATPFDTLHEIGGSRDSVVVDHLHEVAIVSDGSHTHSVDGGNFADSIPVSYFEPTGVSISSTPAGYDVALTHIDNAGAHEHDGNISSTGVAATDKNLQPYRVINYIMRLA